MYLFSSYQFLLFVLLNEVRNETFLNNLDPEGIDLKAKSRQGLGETNKNTQIFEYRLRVEQLVQNFLVNYLNEGKSFLENLKISTFNSLEELRGKLDLI